MWFDKEATYTHSKKVTQLPVYSTKQPLTIPILLLIILLRMGTYQAMNLPATMAYMT